MKARFQLLDRSSKGNKFAVRGEVWVSCELVRSGLTVGHSTGKLVKLTEKGGGYPVGHEIVVADADLK